MNKEEELKEESLVDHLRELRKRLVYGILGIVFCAAGCWLYKELLFDIIRQPIEPFLSTEQKGLIYTGLMENFIAYVKISLLGGVIVSCPFWMYHIWKFLSPALYKKEKRYGVAFIFSGTALFLTGVSFVYFMVYPLAFDFLLSFGQGQDQALITVNEYLSFFLKTTFLFGLAFEIPLILTILGILGIVSSDFLVENRRYAFLFLSFASALMTPPDPLSMLMMAGPMALLYEISIISIKVLAPKT
ncbi:MAG: twin-arginine translocase subunit TatC [Bdellovibrionales bacterium]